MNNFQYTKTEGQGWLVEKPEMEKPDPNKILGANPSGADYEVLEELNLKYKAHLLGIRRFKYDYPDPGKEMKLGKDFEVQTIGSFSVGDFPSDMKISHKAVPVTEVAIPITQRTYSEQDLLDKDKEIEALKFQHEESRKWYFANLELKKEEIKELKSIIRSFDKWSKEE